MCLNRELNPFFLCRLLYVRLSNCFKNVFFVLIFFFARLQEMISSCSFFRSRGE